jgi:hypothetical protein
MATRRISAGLQKNRTAGQDVFGAGINKSIVRAVQRNRFEIAVEAPYRQREPNFRARAHTTIGTHSQAVLSIGVPGAIARFTQPYARASELRTLELIRRNFQNQAPHFQLAGYRRNRLQCQTV